MILALYTTDDRVADKTQDAQLNLTLGISILPWIYQMMFVV